MSETIPLTYTEFATAHSHDSIQHSLDMFAFINKSVLPRLLLDDTSDYKLLLDTLQIEDSDLVIPVVIRSTEWLSIINRVGGDFLQLCLHQESWPKQNRFQLVGGLSDLYESGVTGALLNYLNSSTQYWHGQHDPCRIAISDRVAMRITSDSTNELIDKTSIINLSDEYRETSLRMFTDV